MEWSQIANFAQGNYTIAAKNFQDSPNDSNWLVLVTAALLHLHVKNCPLELRAQVVEAALDSTMGGLPMNLLSAITQQPIQAVQCGLNIAASRTMV